jgi:uncharacterized membrane protein YeiH
VDLLYLLDLMAVGVFAVSGCLAAGRQHLDLIGVYVVAVVTAVGGGTLRDVLLSRHPIFWTADPHYLYVIVFACPLTILYVRFRPPPDQILIIADAVGLSVYSIVGAKFAEAAGKPAIVCVVMGTMTGAAGGVLRDMLCNEVPVLFRRGYLYATAAIVGCTTYLILERTVLPQETAAYIGMGVVGILRIGSIVYKWNLPLFELPGERTPEATLGE